MARTRKQTSAQNLFKYDVLIEDRGERSDYFKLSQFNGYFTGGRNAFLVAGSPVLKPNTKLLVEVLDKNGRAIFSAPAKDFIEANSRLVQVEVYEDTPIGQGKIVILGCAATYADGTPVPKEWQDKYNVRWISNVTISPQKENTTPIRFNTPPSMVVQEKFYFAPESSSFSSTATASLDVKLDTKFFNVFPNGYLLTSKGVPDERYFTKYLGGVFTGSVEINGGNGQEFINVNIPITRIYNRFVAESDGTLLTTNKGTVITDVYLSSSGQYTTLVNKTYPAQVTSSIVLQYNELITQNTGSIISFADVRIVDLSTISGEVHSVEFSYKRTTEPGEYTILGKVPTAVRELLAVDSASRIAETGLFRDVVLKDYWYSTTMSLSRTDTVLPPPEYYTASLVSAADDDTLQSCFFLLDAITGLIPVVDGKFIDNVSYAIGTRETTPLELFPRSEYTLTFDALVSKTSGSTPPITLSQDDYSLEVYLVPLSGSNTTLLETNARGQLIGTLTPENGFSIQNFETVDLNFIPKIIAPGTFGLRFIVYGGFWNIANVSVKPATERFFSPDEISVLLPNEFTHDELVTYRAEYLDINNNSLGIQTTALPTFFDGIGYVSRQGDTMFGELYIKDLPIYTDSLYDAFTGVVSGGVLIINPEDPTEYIITAGSGYYITGSLTDPEYKLVTWPQIIKRPDAFPTSGSVATTSRTNVAIAADGTVFEKSSRFTPEQYRDYIVLGRLAHVGTNTIQRTLSLPLTAYARGYHWFDLASALGIINVNGNIFSPAGSNRQIQKSAGQTYRVGSNYKNDPEFPDITSDPTSNPTTFAYRWRNGSGGFNEAPVTTFVSGGLYDNGTGTLATVNNNQWTTQRIYYFGATNTTRIQFGQFVYNSLSAALSAIQTELFVADPNLLEDAAFRAFLVLRGGAANLSNIADAEFLEAAARGGGGGGGVTTLEQLTDVDIDSKEIGDILQYNGTLWTASSTVPSASYALVAESLQVLDGTSSGVASYSGSFTGSYILNTYRLSSASLGAISTSATISLSIANYFTATVTNTTAWAFEGAEVGNVVGFVLELENGGSAAQTWPTTVRWPEGTAPTLTASGIDVLTFITDDGGSNWRGVASMLDSK